MAPMVRADTEVRAFDLRGGLRALDAAAHRAAEPECVEGMVVAALRRDVAALRQRVAEAAPRRAVVEIDRAITLLDRRLEEVRGAGAGDREETRALAAEVDSLRDAVDAIMAPDRFAALSAGIEAVARKLDLMNAKAVDPVTVARLCAQVGDLKDLVGRVLAGPESSVISALAERVAACAAQVTEAAAAATRAMAAATAAFEERAGAVLDRLERAGAEAPAPGSGLGEAFRAEFGRHLGEMNARLDRLADRVAALPPEEAARFTDRLAQLLERMEADGGMTPAAMAPLFEVMEHQLQLLTERMGRSDKHLNRLDGIETMLRQLTGELQAMRDGAAESAAEAARAVVLKASGHPDGPAVVGLKRGLAALEARQSHIERRAGHLLGEDAMRGFVEDLEMELRRDGLAADGDGIWATVRPDLESRSESRSDSRPEPGPRAPQAARAPMELPAWLVATAGVPRQERAAAADAAGPDAAWHDAAWHDAARRDPAWHDAAWQDPVWQDPAWQDPGRHDAGRPDAGWRDASSDAQFADAAAPEWSGTDDTASAGCSSPSAMSAEGDLRDEDRRDQDVQDDAGWSAPAGAPRAGGEAAPWDAAPWIPTGVAAPAASGAAAPEVNLGALDFSARLGDVAPPDPAARIAGAPAVEPFGSARTDAAGAEGVREVPWPEGVERQDWVAAAERADRRTHRSMAERRLRARRRDQWRRKLQAVLLVCAVAGAVTGAGAIALRGGPVMLADAATAIEHMLARLTGTLTVADLPAPIGSDALRGAALAGDAAAAYEVGVRYAEGRGAPANPDAARRWLTFAMDHGSVPAAYRLGSMAELGRRDLKEAQRLYVFAADRGNLRAMHNLGVLYSEGLDGPADWKQAAAWFRKAAELGLRDAQYNLGVIYSRGFAGGTDVAEAWKWFALAANQGDTESARKRDALAARADHDTVARAKIAADAFAPGSVNEAANAVALRPEWGGTNPFDSAQSLGGMAPSRG